MTSSGGSRVSIPADLLETIQNIREITGKQHSDEDIFSVFKDCFNDPHETAQRLLYLDTFHEVKSKRERKKEERCINFSQDKDHESSNSTPETELALQSDQTVHLVEGSEVEKLKEAFLPIKDTHQTENCDGPPISYPDQCSIAASQQAMHFFRKQYPLNFFPYGPYYPPFYMPQPYIHQFLSPNQQQSYVLPGDDAPAPTGDKLPLPHIKSGTNIGNSPPITFPSPYDSYAAAFNHIPSAATINSTHKEEKKENIYTTGPLSLANLQANAMYNLSLQGQPLAFATLQAGFTGIYQQTQPILGAPTISSMTEQPKEPHT